jgi:opacity protein-like surface antigen
VTYGAGVQYDFTRRIAVRGQWQRYDTEEKIDLLSIGAIVRF